MLVSGVQLASGQDKSEPAQQKSDTRHRDAGLQYGSESGVASLAVVPSLPGLNGHP